MRKKLIMSLFTSEFRVPFFSVERKRRNSLESSDATELLQPLYYPHLAEIK